MMKGLKWFLHASGVNERCKLNHLFCLSNILPNPFLFYFYMYIINAKTVDEVVPRTPYVMTSEYLDWIIKTYKIDYVVHGDDPCIGPDGKDVYADVKGRGMFKSIPRTEGVSTTEIVGRMLLMTTRHHLKSSPGENEKHGLLVSDPKFNNTHLPFGYRESRFLTTSRMLRLFSQPPPLPIEKGMKVVYINGGFDMFHAGHASILKKAKALGDYLLVGV